MKIHSSCEIEDFVETHLCKLVVCDTPIARITSCLCVLIKDIGRRLPLQLQCSYQGQQGDFSQSVRGNYKTRFWGGQNLTAVEGNVSFFYHVNLVSRVTGEGGGAEFWRTRGPGFDQKRAGLEGEGGERGQFVHVSYKSFRGDKSDGFGTSNIYVQQGDLVMTWWNVTRNEHKEEKKCNPAHRPNVFNECLLLCAPCLSYLGTLLHSAYIARRPWWRCVRCTLRTACRLAWSTQHYCCFCT